MAPRPCRSRVACMSAIGLLVAEPSLAWVAQRFFDPRDCFAEQGVDGPYEALDGPDGAPGIGRTLAGVPPGGRFAWVSRVCLDLGQLMRADVRLVRLADGNSPERELSRHKTPFGPKDARCGAMIGRVSVLRDAPAGRYELRRGATLRPNGWLPLTVSLDPVRIKVTAR